MKRCSSDCERAEGCKTTFTCAWYGDVDPTSCEFFQKGSVYLFSGQGCGSVLDLGGMGASGISPHRIYQDMDWPHYSEAWFDLFKTTGDMKYLLPDTQGIAVTPCRSSTRSSTVLPSWILPGLAGLDALQAGALPIQRLVAYSYSWGYRSIPSRR